MSDAPIDLATERRTFYSQGEADGWHAALGEVERRIDDAELRECDNVRIVRRILAELRRGQA